METIYAAAILLASATLPFTLIGLAYEVSQLIHELKRKT